MNGLKINRKRKIKKIGKVDACGYELMHDQPYYDIWIGKRGDPNRTYVKHVPENQIERIKK